MLRSKTAVNRSAMESAIAWRTSSSSIASGTGTPARASSMPIASSFGLFTVIEMPSKPTRPIRIARLMMAGVIRWPANSSLNSLSLSLAGGSAAQTAATWASSPRMSSRPRPLSQASVSCLMLASEKPCSCSWAISLSRARCPSP
jgi:hypothetical protein